MNAICYPHPDCPDKEQCSRYAFTKDQFVLQPMNAMPYRVEGQPCQWFVEKVDEA